MSDSLGVRSGGCADSHHRAARIVSMSEPGGLSRNLLFKRLWGGGERLNIPQDQKDRIHLFIHTTNTSG